MPSMPTLLTIPDPCLVLLVGAAGSGKTTLAARLFAPAEVLSSDALRAAIAGDAGDQSASGAAFKVLHRAVATRLAAGRLAVVDATNVRRDHRRPLLATARRAGVPAVAIVLDLPSATVHVRAATRHRVVAPDVVERQLGWLRRSLAGAATGGEALAEEGFAAVFVLHGEAEVDGVRLERRPVRNP